MTNPFVNIKRLLQDSPDQSGRPSRSTAQRFENDFMKYDLTADARF